VDLLKKIFLKREKGVLAFGLLFFSAVPYKLIGSFTAGRPTYDLSVIFDYLVPFLPATILIYLSLYALLIAPFFIVKDIGIFRRAALAIFLVQATSFAVFLLCPAYVQRPFVPDSSAFEQLFGGLYAIDPPFNTFPSLHVAQSFLSAYICYLVNKKFGWFFLWSALISASTLFVKQHVLADVFAGFILFLIVAFLVFRKYNKQKV
jgi:membrane-associated phospholipid phosphatase